MKLMCIILSFDILFAGCFANTPVTKEDTQKDNGGKVTFWLHDGTYITSEGGQYHRVENGYKVVGAHIGRYDQPLGFVGVIKDEQIYEITHYRFQVGRTIGGIAKWTGIFLLCSSVVVGVMFAVHPD